MLLQTFSYTIKNPVQMKSYKEITISPISEEEEDLFIGLLSDLEYSGFEQENNQLKAYIDDTLFDLVALNALAKEFNFQYAVSNLQEQNWNELWESNFSPVLVDDFVGLRANFHPSFGNQVEHELVITPKMSFGTGHHATTYMMIQQMRNLQFEDKTVFDFGTGTGILAILAEKLGAKSVLAIDNDEWSINNSQENLEANNVSKIELQLLSTIPTEQSFDIILANINLNVIVENLKFMFGILKNGGNLVLSGLLKEDEKTILDVAAPYNLKHENTLTRLNWISMLFSK
ncbi:MAG: 50S ribosomal protein L11 methyltransferase [Pseudopedobacter saltans]|uniref:Ribosomal protein L11 methyltransferase n=1 Tax=Pseudopedobacter saltans TaxID=151895 RepID=A0A2W5FAV5_9SPHI|nr:MAG: 50S ribosomal protein L11 methyltransferase [Pseudopedobacter saltans]